MFERKVRERKEIRQNHGNAYCVLRIAYCVLRIAYCVSRIYSRSAALVVSATDYRQCFPGAILVDPAGSGCHAFAVIEMQLIIFLIGLSARL
jgi:hypothetical protein